jgi:nitroreductase
MRWFLPGDVPEWVLDELLWAATRAGSAHNSQPWHFIVVRDPESKSRIAEAIRESVSRRDPLPPVHSDAEAKIDAGVRNLFNSLQDVPVLIFVCATNDYPEHAPNSKFMWSAISNAAQNLLVAARALGYGAGYTMLHTLAEPAIRAELNVPDDVTIGVMMPVGRPARAFGPLRRKPMAEVVRYDHW